MIEMTREEQQNDNKRVVELLEAVIVELRELKELTKLGMGGGL